MTYIKNLTPEQRARFPEFVERWTKIGLSTDSAEHAEAERAIHMMYEAAGKKPPAKIVWCGSPMSQGLTRAIIMDRKLMDRIGASVWDSVWASVGASVGASVRDSVWDSVRDSVWDSVGDSVWDSVYGQHDTDWLAFYDFFHSAVGLESQTKKLGGLWLLARSAGWALPHENICWVSERHNVLRRDDRGRLHAGDGPAVAFPDGWAIYAFHGVRVPAWVIDNPTEITAPKIDAESNAEVKRVMIERYPGGMEAYLHDAGAKLVDHDERWGTLYRKDLGDGSAPIMSVAVVNRSPEPDGSFKKYCLTVHPDLRPLPTEYNRFTEGEPQALTARNAVASTFGMRGDQYAAYLPTLAHES